MASRNVVTCKHVLFSTYLIVNANKAMGVVTYVCHSR